MGRVSGRDLRIGAGNRHEWLLERTHVIGLVKREILDRSDHACGRRKHVDAGILAAIRSGDEADLQVQWHAVRTLHLPIAKRVADHLRLLRCTEAQDAAVKLHNNAVAERSC